MHCFHHPTHPAVGVCQACGKGLCHDCVQEGEHGLTCLQADCASRVRRISQVLDNSYQALRMANRQNRSTALFFAALGLMLCGVGAPMLSVHRAAPFSLFLMLLGLVCLVTGLTRLRMGVPLPKAEPAVPVAEDAAHWPTHFR